MFVMLTDVQATGFLILTHTGVCVLICFQLHTYTHTLTHIIKLLMRQHNAKTNRICQFHTFIYICNSVNNIITCIVNVYINY
jgi:hypothetical protein